MAALAARTTTHRIPQGASLVEEQDGETWMGFVIEGECEVTQSVLGADDRVLAVMSPGRVFGEFALIDGEPRSATITAIEDTTVLRLGSRDLDALAADDPASAYAVIRRIAVDLTRRLRQRERDRF